MDIIKLPFKVKRPILSCGADLKSAFSFAKGRTAFFLGGFGDLGDLDNFTNYGKAIAAAERKLQINPKIIACDLHPGYFSSQFARNYTLHPRILFYKIHPCTLYEIQHHEAHIASAMADNSITGKVIGIAFDGTGFGSDGNIWGGEFFVGDVKEFRRAAHLEYLPMPGSEWCIREPFRMAASYLYKTFGDKLLGLKVDLVKNMDKKRWAVLKKMIDNSINSPLTSSMGRLFDAVGSLVLAREKASFEAELPIELEKRIDGSCGDLYNFDVESEGGGLIINVRGAIKGIVNDLSKKTPDSIISAKFHNTIVGIILKISLILKKKFKINKVVLSGGVFQNRYLVARTLTVLKEKGFVVYKNSGTPANDLNIPIGQIVIANARGVK